MSVLSPQRLGCIHSEELPYVFGVPLFYYDYDSADSESAPAAPEMMRTDISDGGGDYVSVPIASSPPSSQVKVKDEKMKREELGFFTGNYTWDEVQLSLTIMRLWANFVRVG